MERVNSPKSGDQSVSDEATSSPKPEKDSGHGFRERLEEAIAKATRSLLDRQHPDGYWVEPLDADVTIPAEYIMFQFILGRKNDVLFRKLAEYILSIQGADGGWPLFTGGAADISASVKAYFALKLLGYSPDHPALAKARALILERGGATTVNVFTRIILALFGQYDWKGIPALPCEMILLPKWFPLSIYTVSYWSRTVIIPLLIIYHYKPVTPIPPGQGVDELFLKPMEEVHFGYSWDKKLFSWKNLFFVLDYFIQHWNRHPPGFLRKKALSKSVEWLIPRMKGDGGLGAIYPAMANSVIALRLSGYSDDHPLLKRAISSIDDLVFTRDNMQSVQPCHSPIWDTALSLGALFEAGVSPDHPAISRSLEWFRRKEVKTVGDWSVHVTGVEPGGWAFEFENDYYPDVDDTAVILMDFAKWTNGFKGYEDVVRRAARWVLAMQCTDGGWASFDKDNDLLFLNNIPFADHGALLDPSTADLTGRVLEFLGLYGYRPDFPPVARALDYLRREQESNGSWYGRWGVNYIYGTWSVISAFRALGVDMKSSMVQRAMGFLLDHQNADGGWGESCLSYYKKETAGVGESTPSQTAWALISLVHGEHADSPAVRKGIDWLLENMRTDGRWDETLYTGTGFARVFYLRYNMYRDYFPLWALALYQNVHFEGASRVSGKVAVWRKQPFAPLASFF